MNELDPQKAREKELELQKTRELVAVELHKLQPRAESEEGGESPAALYGGYHEAASVLSFFDVERLKPTRPGEDELEDLIADSALVYDEEGGSHWTILPEVRREVLRQLGTREAMLNALAANPDRPQDTLQTVLERCLRGALPNLDGQSLEELVCIYQVLDWLPEGAAAGLPDKQEVARRTEHLRLLQPFHKLVGGHFRGRGAELQRLHDYVGVLPPGSAYESFKRDVKEFFSLHERPPLLIHAPGGMGKSTLVAKFILDHATLAREDRFPFVYIDFDRPSLMAEEPLTLLIESVRQLGTQYPEARGSCEKIVSSWHEQLTAALRRSRRSEDSLVESERRPAPLSDRSQFLSAFGDLLKSLNISDRPLLLVLDTFEEVQYRSQAYILELWRFLDELQRTVPRLRVVLSGRSMVKDFEAEELKLPVLDPAASQGFLEDRGVKPPEVAAAIARQMGGDPLSLKLAANVFKLEGADAEGIRDLKTRELKLGIIPLRIDQSRIQGQLYERILKHIHTEEIKALAHPGLILRRITPEIILKVLAGPCGVTVNDPAQAGKIFEELRREVSLVVTAEDGSLRHRPDVRRVMVKLLQASDEKEKVDSIQQAAVSYYEQQEGVIARAEEIYHRLLLKQDHSIVERRWLDGVQTYLYNAVEELAPSEQAFLASRLDIELDEQVWKEADLEDWERRAAQNVGRLLQVGDLDKALVLLGERRERTLGSPLYLLEARIYEQTNHWERARELIARGVESVSQAGDVDKLYDLLMVGARAEAALGDPGAARGKLAAAGDIARRRGNKVGVLRVDLELARLPRGGDDDPKAFEKIIDEVAVILDAMTDAELSEYLSLLRGLAAALGKRNPSLLSRAVRLVGIETASPSQRRALARAITACEEEVARELQAEPGVIARAARLEPSGTLFETWTSFLNTASGGAIAKTFSFVMEHFKISEGVLGALLDILRAPESQDAPPSGRHGDARRSGTSSPAFGKLTGQQLEQLHDALIDAFPLPEHLEQMLLFRLDRELNAIALGNSYNEQVFQVIMAAQAEGWVANLIIAARESNPGNIKLQALATQLGLGISGAAPQNLERVIRSDTHFDIVRWRMKLGELEGIVCRVEVNASAWWGKRYGTGFLVGPNLLLTTYHLVEEVVAGKVGQEKVNFRFDYKSTADGMEISQGTVFTLHPDDWLVDYSVYTQGDAGAGGISPAEPSLDYALLRLASSPGNEPIGGDRAEMTAKVRGWITVPEQPYLPTPNSPIFILQHPEAGPLQLSLESDGIIGLSPDGMRLRYRVNTAPGSTGAPCFNANWELLAMHQRSQHGATEGSEYSEGSLISAVVSLLKERGKYEVLSRSEY